MKGRAALIVVGCALALSFGLNIFLGYVFLEKSVAESYGRQIIREIDWEQTQLADLRSQFCSEGRSSLTRERLTRWAAGQKFHADLREKQGLVWSGSLGFSFQDGLANGVCPADTWNQVSNFSPAEDCRVQPLC